MEENKLDFIYKFLKEREQAMARHKKNAEMFEKIAWVAAFAVVLIIFLSIIGQIFQGVAGIIRIVKSDDIKLAIGAVCLINLGFFLLWYTLTMLPDLFFPDKKGDK